jgi:hypothetical protein
MILTRRLMKPDGFLYAGGERVRDEAGGLQRPPGQGYMVQNGGMREQVSVPDDGPPLTSRGPAPGRLMWGQGTQNDLTRDLERGERVVDLGNRQPGARPGAPAVNYEGVAAVQRRMMAPDRGGGGQVDRDGDGLPDGAEVSKVVTTTGEDGAQTKTTAKWIHRGADSNTRSYQGDNMRFSPEQREDIERRRSMFGAGRDTVRSRQMMDVLGRRDERTDRPGREAQEREMGRIQFVEPAEQQRLGQEGAARETAEGVARAADANSRQPVIGAQGAAQRSADGGMTVTPFPERTQVGDGVVVRPGEAPQWAPDSSLAVAEERTKQSIIESQALGATYQGPIVKMPGGLFGIWDGKRYRPQRPPSSGAFSMERGEDGMMRFVPGGSSPIDVDALPVWEQGGRGAASGAGVDDGIPTMTPEQAQGLPPGAKFRGADGKVRVRQ